LQRIWDTFLYIIYNTEQMKLSWNTKEWLIISLAWLLVFAYDPICMFYADMVAGESKFHWDILLSSWLYTSVFLVLFLVHHFVLLPRLVEKKNTWFYVIGTTLSITLFIIFLFVYRDSHKEHHRYWMNERGSEILKDESMHHRPHKRPPHIFNKEGERPEPPISREPKVKPLLLAPPDLSRLIMAVLMLLVDIGAVSWTKTLKLKQQVLLLEQQALKQELNQLRYQINPHFFMNTLNNIHALIDIDQERAKRAIVELSGMMRYSLYEGNDNVAPLNHEIEFLKLYISLMRLRFSNKVDLQFDVPVVIPSEVMVPPLLLTTFVENAFKHGISYQRESYIYIKLDIEETIGQIHFRCENSSHSTMSAKDEHHGIGLVNVCKRLDLQYSNNYRLIIDDKDSDKFVVDLMLPITNSSLAC